MEDLSNLLFYNLDKAIRSYRQYAHQQLSANGFDITIDQWLVLRALSDHPDFSQQQIAEMTFKDYASLTRIIELLVQKGYLNRSAHAKDRRRFTLTLTTKAHGVLKAMQPVIDENRQHALKGLNAADIKNLQGSLNQIIQNCGTEPIK